MIPRAAIAVTIGLAAIVATTLFTHGDRSHVPRRDDVAVAAMIPSAVPSAPLAGTTSPPVRHGRDPGREPSGQWVDASAALSGVPAVAVRAYGRAVLQADDGCGLSWTTLAGIGYVESDHGTIDGRSLADDGTSSSLVVGPALDGSSGVAAIAASRSATRRHGDPRWDHAVGPLQFIDSTWRRWTSDGDGDGRKDPGDLDDAALAAARYLCADGHDLATGAGWSAAVLSYNHDPAYVQSVHAAATVYAARLSP